MEREKRLRALFGRVFDSCREDLKAELPAQEYERRRQDFVFHMTDWESDLSRFADVVSHPETQKKSDTEEFLIGFLYHVVPHLSAAGRLLLDNIPDPFAETEPVGPHTGRPATKTV